MRRISDAALQAERHTVLAEIRSTGPSRNVPEFNCEIVTKVHPTMCIASIGAQSVTSTRFISVPFITNVKDVVQGEELICELVARPKPKKVAKINWRDVAKEEQEGRRRQPRLRMRSGRRQPRRSPRLAAVAVSGVCGHRLAAVAAAFVVLDWPRSRSLSDEPGKMGIALGARDSHILLICAWVTFDLRMG